MDSCGVLIREVVHGRSLCSRRGYIRKAVDFEFMVRSMLGYLSPFELWIYRNFVKDVARKSIIDWISFSGIPVLQCSTVLEDGCG